MKENLRLKILNFKFAISPKGFTKNSPLPSCGEDEGEGWFSEKGFTLVEVLMAVFIGMVVMAAGMALFSTSNVTYTVQTGMSEAQQNARVATEFISRDIKTAGFGFPEGPYTFSFENQCTGAASTDTFSRAITHTNNSDSPDSITIVGIGSEAGVLVDGDTFCGCSGACNGNGDSFICLRKTDMHLFTNNGAGSFCRSKNNISIGGAQFVVINLAGAHTTSESGGNRYYRMALASTLDRDYPVGTPVYVVQAVTYTVATDLTDCSSSTPCLASNDRVNGRQVIASGIEDIQFAYGIDADINGVIDDLDLSGGYSDGDFKSNPTLNLDKIAAIRVNISAMAPTEDKKAISFKRPALEDRAAATQNDGYRRMVMRKVVTVRNPGGS